MLACSTADAPVVSFVAHAAKKSCRTMNEQQQQPQRTVVLRTDIAVVSSRCAADARGRVQTTQKTFLSVVRRRGTGDVFKRNVGTKPSYPIRDVSLVVRSNGLDSYICYIRCSFDTRDAGLPTVPSTGLFRADVCCGLVNINF
jgi:hypothetical protein